MSCDEEEIIDYEDVFTISYSNTDDIVANGVSFIDITINSKIEKLNASQANITLVTTTGHFEGFPVNDQEITPRINNKVSTIRLIVGNTKGEHYVAIKDGNVVINKKVFYLLPSKSENFLTPIEVFKPSSNDTFKANGITSLTFRTKIKDEILEKYNEISFKKTINNNTEESISVVADPNGFCSASFNVGSIPGKMQVEASLVNNENIKMTKTITLLPPNTSEIFEICKLNKIEGFANGIDELILELKLSQELLSNTSFNRVMLKSSAVDFEDNNTGSYEIGFNNAGVIKTTMTLKKDPGNHKLNIIFKDLPYIDTTLNFSIIPLEPDSIISISYDNNKTYRADGLTKIDLNVCVTNYSFDQFILETNKGTILGNATVNKTEMGANGCIVKQLDIGREPGTYQVYAEIANENLKSKKVDIAVEKANPENIIFDKGYYQVDTIAGSTFSFKVYLTRGTGEVSSSVTIDPPFIYRDINGSKEVFPLGKIQFNGLDTYKLGSGDYIQLTYENTDPIPNNINENPVYIEIKTYDDNGNPISKSLKINFSITK